MADDRPPQMLDRDDGARIAYRHTPAATGPALPGVVFLGGFKSDMEGGKALRLEAFCGGRGQQFTRFDYRGHGLSSGRFEDGTIGLWLSDALAVLDAVTSGRQILVGSSMGGWIALLAALRRPERVAGLVGVAPAPDFVVRMEGDLTPGQRAALERDGRFERPSAYSEDPYIVTRALIEDGKRHLLLDGPIPLDLPVRILHGMCDDAVPWQLSLILCERLVSRDVRIAYVKDGDHRLSNEPELQLLCETVDEVGRRIAG